LSEKLWESHSIVVNRLADPHKFAEENIVERVLRDLTNQEAESGSIVQTNDKKQRTLSVDSQAKLDSRLIKSVKNPDDSQAQS
jgi:hypothetical protein